MSSYYLPQIYNPEENAQALELSETLGKIILAAPLRICMMGLFRALVAFIGVAINESHGKNLSRRLADDRQLIMEYVGDLLDEQIAWSEKAQESQERVSNARNN